MRKWSIGWLLIVPWLAQANTILKNIYVTTLPGAETQVRFQVEGELPAVKEFSIESPAKIVLDFSNSTLNINPDQKKLAVDEGIVRRVTTQGIEGRVRTVIDLLESAAYTIKKEGQYVVLSLRAVSSPQTTLPFSQAKTNVTGQYHVNMVDFKRGEEGVGRIVVQLSDPYVPIVLKEESNTLRVRLQSASVPSVLEKILDVTDFGTPVEQITTENQNGDVWITIKTEGEIDTLAYQTDKTFTIEVRKKADKVIAGAGEVEYTGERLSLNFQSIEVRAVLQLLAEFTGINVVASDTVTGSVTLRLRNVPWDEALDIILKTKGLAKRQAGNVLLVGPAEELAAREKQALEATQQVSDLAPLYSEFIQVNYAKAAELAALLKDEKNSLLSSRGNIATDTRTNTLLVQDTAQKIDEVRALVQKLDIPVRQVLIESRIVVATDNFEKALGVKFGSAADIRHTPIIGFTGNRVASDTLTTGTEPSAIGVSDRLNVNLPMALTNSTGNAQFGLTIGRLPGGTVLDLELSALESEGLGKIISSPRLVTSNQQKAFIESGEEIPYQESAASGAVTIAFKKAVLRLEVEPQITPDDRIILDLTVNQDTRGVVLNSIPAINTQQIHTIVLVDNGETVVLGGIYEQTKRNNVTRVPFLGRIPGLGWLFKNVSKIDNREELMIFVTPKIINEAAW